MRAVLLSLVLLLLSLSGVVAAEDRPLALVVRSVSSVREGLETAVREAIAVEAKYAAWNSGSSRAKADFRVEVHVSRFSSRLTLAGTEVRCEVSVIVSDADGAMRVVLRGRAGATGRLAATRLERAVLRAAVRSALRGLGSELVHVS